MSRRTVGPVARLRALPTEALALLIEAAIAELDARDGDPDAEPEVDCCPALDDMGGALIRQRAG